MTNLNDFFATCAAILLRDDADPRALPAHIAQSNGLFTTTAAGEYLDVNGRRVSASVKGGNLLRGVYYARRILVQDGREFPAPRVGDIFGLRVNTKIIAAYEVRAVGADAPGDHLTPGNLCNDEVVVELRPDLGSITDLPIQLENPTSVGKELRGR